MKLFLKKIAVFSLFSALMLVSLSRLLLENNRASYHILYEYQIEKIKRAGNIDTLFIGDSSLGNSIDSGEFSALSSRKALNCALMGLYGYAGSYNMLKTAYEHHPEIKNVVLMQTLDMQTRPVSYAGYVRTTDSWGDFSELSGSEKRFFLKEGYYYIESIRLLDLLDKKGLIKNDYIKQGEKKDFSYDTEAFDVQKIDPDKNRFLKKIVDYAERNHLNVVYLNGPLYERRAAVSESYISAVREIISGTGIRMIPDMVTLRNDELGDSDDHVRSELKKKYTRVYYELLKKYLQ